jgi:hypothetical protein
MEDVIEVKKSKLPVMTINHGLDKYDNVILFPEKLKSVNEYFEKYPLPADFYLDSFSKTQQEYGFEVTGILKRADVDKNIFHVVEMDGPYEVKYNIRTTPEILHQLVKVFLDKTIKVHIRPQINADNLFEYGLIEVKVD